MTPSQNCCMVTSEKHSDSKTTASLILEKEMFFADYLYNSTKPTRISDIFHSNRPVTCSSPVILLGVLSPDFTALPFGAVLVFSRMGVLWSFTRDKHCAVKHLPKIHESYRNQTPLQPLGPPGRWSMFVLQVPASEPTYDTWENQSWGGPFTAPLTFQLHPSLQPKLLVIPVVWQCWLCRGCLGCEGQVQH